MGLFDKLRGLVGGGAKSSTPPALSPRFDLAELLRRLELDPSQVSLEPRYTAFTIAKRNGQPRRILAPDATTRDVQRRILRRVLGRLRAHPAAHGFERGRSILTNAAPHAGHAVILKMDLVDFFPRTTATRVRAYFRTIGWDERAADFLTLWTTHEGGLPQGAPTSPRLSNLVNYKMDARLHGHATFHGAVYTRYADDLTFSWAESRPRALAEVLMPIRFLILPDFGYTLHIRRKLQIKRQDQRQMVTGLVVNQRPNLPRETRRRLRAIEHHLATGRPATLTPAQFAGWQAFRRMLG